MEYYYLDPTQQYPQELTRCPGMNPVMRVLEEVLSPIPTHIPTFKDCVLISLDAEYDSHTHQISQIGIACLDTRDIRKAHDTESSKNIITSRLLLLQRQSTHKGVYLFGKPEECYGKAIENLLVSIFQIPDLRTTSLRNIILIGHSIRNDIREIEKSSNFSVTHLPTIKAMVDTSPLINKVYNTSSRYHSLRDTCTLLGMFKRNIHTAGNDAMYTLKALLLIFCHYKEEKQNWTFVNDLEEDQKLLYECHIEALKRIGRCNNGVGRFMKQRRGRKKDSPFEERSKVQSHDVLDWNETEIQGVVDRLFMI